LLIGEDNKIATGNSIHVRMTI